MRTRAPRSGPPAAGMTLVEVLMSMLVMGIGVLGVVSLLPLAFVRAVQATNLTNGTILRYNTESMIDVNPRLLLRWQANQAYSNTTPMYNAATNTVIPNEGDIVIVPNTPNYAFQCTTGGISGLVTPNWNTTIPPLTTTDGSVTWTAIAMSPTATPQFSRFVIDPMGWYAMNAITANAGAFIGNNGSGAPPTAPQVPIARFNGELPNGIAAALQAYLPDSWVEQARAPVANFTTNSVTLNNIDLSGVTFTSPAQVGPAPPTVPPPTPYSISRVVLIDATGTGCQTRLITNIQVAGGNSTVSWGGSPPAPAPGSDPLIGGFTPVAARVEMQELRYTWMLTVLPSSGGGSSNVIATVFFHRSLTSTDEQSYAASGVDGVQTPFTINYTGTKPFAPKGSFLFDIQFGRWYRIVNVANDTGSSFQVFVDQPRPQVDVLSSASFTAVFMRGVVDVFPLPLK